MVYNETERKREKQLRRLERDYALPASLASAALTYLTITSAAQHIKDLPSVHFPDWIPIGFQSNWIPIGFQLVAIALAIVAAVLTWRKQRLGDDEGTHIEEHASKHLAIEGSTGEPAREFSS